MSVLGVDIGSVRIGLAICRAGTRIAVPLETVPARPGQAAVERILALARENGARRIVVGMPLELDGTEGRAARKARLWIDALRAARVCPVVPWDERLTTKSAERAMREADVGRDTRRAMIDQMAACLILEGWMASRANR